MQQLSKDEPLLHHTLQDCGKASFAAAHSHVALVRVLEVLAANQS